MAGERESNQLIKTISIFSDSGTQALRSKHYSWRSLVASFAYKRSLF